MKNRISWIDIAKGIGIMLMVIGHMPNYIPKLLYNMIYAFHMPLFFALSGYFFKESCVFDFNYVRKKAKHLLTPYFAFSFTFMIIENLIAICGGGMRFIQYCNI